MKLAILRYVRAKIHANSHQRFKSKTQIENIAVEMYTEIPKLDPIFGRDKLTVTSNFQNFAKVA